MNSEQCQWIVNDERTRQKGFTLIELLIAIAVFGIVLSAIYSVFMSANKSQVAQDLIVEMQQNARSAAEFVVRELKNIDTISCMENSSTTCSTSGDKITFTSVIDSDTRIFSWSSSDNILRFSKSSGSANRQPLSENITAFTLTPNTTTVSNIGKIDISLTARTSKVDPNTNDYHTYTITTSAKKRN